MKSFEFTDEEIKGLIDVLKDDIVGLETVGEPMFKKRYEMTKLLLRKLGYEKKFKGFD